MRGKKLRVLFNTSPGAFKSMGGGEVQLLKTKQELQNLGHSVAINDQNKDFSRFDVFHNFNIHRDCFPAINAAIDAGLPVAVSTIYWPSLRFALMQNKGIGARAKTLAVEFINRADIAAVSSVKRTLRKVNALLPNSKAEAAMLSRRFGIADDKIFVVPNGVNLCFKASNKGLFAKKYGLENFVLYVGRIEQRKNVLGLIRAMRNIDEQLVVIGDAKKGSEAYYERCRHEAGGNVKFMAAMPHESKMLRSAYAACKVFALPSWYETPGLAALEAALAGANIVITREGSTKEYFRDFASYVNPSNGGGIREKIQLELRKGKDNALQKHVERNFLWKNAAVATLNAYEKILQGEKK